MSMLVVEDCDIELELSKFTQTNSDIRFMSEDGRWVSCVKADKGDIGISGTRRSEVLGSGDLGTGMVHHLIIFPHHERAGYHYYHRGYINNVNSASLGKVSVDLTLTHPGYILIKIRKRRNLITI
ncbi:unnamed protein product [Gordionus sp. m RMFG-2023]